MYFLAHKPLLPALIIAVLAIGGCLPCQKLFGGQSSQKSCCNSKGECQRPSPETPGKKACNLQIAGMQSEPQQHSERLIDGSPADTGESIVDSAPVSYSAVQTACATQINFSPPPLFLLNLALLI